VESLYLLTAPVIAAVGLLLVLGGLCVATVGLLRPGKSRPAAGALAPARWFADLERWRIATVGSLAVRPQDAGGRPRPKEITASDPGLWLDAAHTVVVLPVALVTAVVTAIWWFAALGTVTSALRAQFTSVGTLRPMTLYVGSPQSHIGISLGLTSPPARYAFGTTVGLLLLLTLPLLTRAACSPPRPRCWAPSRWRRGNSPPSRRSAPACPRCRPRPRTPRWASPACCARC
jgi:hypothetical protein